MPEYYLFISLFLIFYTYFGYPAILLIWSLFKNKPNYQEYSQNLPSISILIAAYNEEDIILEKLENIKKMKYAPGRIEVLIGSDASDDNTNQIIASSDIAFLRLIEFNERRGKPAVLNDLAKIATGEYLVFSDANTKFSPDALIKLVEPFTDDTIGGVIGNLSFRTNGIDNPGGVGETLYFKYENFIKNLEGLIHSTIVANGSVYAIRRELYKPMPVKKLIMDDLFIPLSLIAQEFRLVFRKDIHVREDPSLSAREEFEKKERIVAGGMEVVRQFKKLLHPKNGFISFALWSHKVVRWMIPILLVIAFLSNLFLFSNSPFFGILFILQLAFYLSAILGKYLEKIGIKFTPFILSYYFIIVNLAIVSGFKRFLKGSAGTTWKRTRRV